MIEENEVSGASAANSFEEAVLLVPEEWTAWELRTRGQKTRFVFVMTKLGGDSYDIESEPGRGGTPTEAVLNAIAKLPEPPA